MMDSTLLISNLQQWLHPADALLKWLSLHTYSYNYLLIATILYLSGFTRAGARMGCATLLSSLSFGACRHFFASPRPYWEHPELFKGLYEKIWGMPSGHSQIGMVFWGTAAYSTGRRWCWIIALSIVATIALSRLFLGLHYPDQVIIGLTAGACILLVWVRMEATVINWLFKRSLHQQVLYILLFTSTPLVTTLILHELLNIGQGVNSLFPYKFMVFYTGVFQCSGVCLLYAFQYSNITDHRFSIKLVLSRTLPALIIAIPFWSVRNIYLECFEALSLIYTALWLHGVIIAGWICLWWPQLHQYLTQKIKIN